MRPLYSLDSWLYTAAKLVRGVEAAPALFVWGLCEFQGRHRRGRWCIEKRLGRLEKAVQIHVAAPQSTGLGDDFLFFIFEKKKTFFNFFTPFLQPSSGGMNPKLAVYLGLAVGSASRITQPCIYSRHIDTERCGNQTNHWKKHLIYYRLTPSFCLFVTYTAN